MSVLDLGSGIGDVSLLAAEIVGPQGRVLGLDRDPAVVEKASARLIGESLADRVTFQIADLGDYETTARFDAIVGRYVLLYQPDPVAVLRRFLRFLRPGGVVVFHDIDMTNAQPSDPPCPVWDEPYPLLAAAFRATGAVPDFGRRLAPVFRAAGLSDVTVEATIPVAAGPESPVLDWIARVFASLRPLLDDLGLELPAGLSYEQLGDTWRAALATELLQLHGPVQYGAWARIS